MPDENELNQENEETAAEHTEWMEQVNSILAPKDPEPMRDN